MTIIGIDPGKSGGIAVLRDGLAAMACATPLSGGEIDVAQVTEIIRGASPDIAVVERVAARPGQGVSSMFSFGRSYGIVLGVLGALGIRTELVLPQAWKRVVLAGSAKDKDAAITYCRRAFPSVSLVATERSRKLHDGIADALCLASYGSRAFGMTS